MFSVVQDKVGNAGILEESDEERTVQNKCPGGSFKGPRATRHPGLCGHFARPNLLPLPSVAWKTAFFWNFGIFSSFFK